MAFSGRARRPGAFSSSKPAEALSDEAFVGEWLDEDGEKVVIKDSKIHASDGGVMALTMKSANQASFKMDGETYDGTLSADGGKIMWSDGAAWTRKGAKPGGAASPAVDPAEEQRKVEEEETRKRAEAEAQEARRKAEEAARKKAQDAELAKKAAALEKAKAAKAAAEAAAAAQADAPPASGGDEAKARSDAGLDKARQAFEAEKARKAAALERAKAAKAAQDASAAEAGGVDDAKAKSQEGIDKARSAFEAEKARKAAALERARAAKAAAEEGKGAEDAAPSGGADEAKARSDAGLDKARSAFEAEKARKAAALERARAAKAAAEADKTAEDPKVVEAKAKSQAGLDKARAAFEAEKARKAAALEKARAAKAAAEEGKAEAASPGKEVDEAKAKSDAGLNKARAAFEAEKARKAAALEKARAAKAAQEAAEQDGGKGKEFEDAKAKSSAGLDKARAAFEAEKARKAAALEKARAAKAAAEAAAKEGGGRDEDDDPPPLAGASGAAAGSSRRSAFSSALNQSQPAPEPTVFTGPPKGKTMSAFTPGQPQELSPPDSAAPEVEMVTEVVQLSEADFEPGIVVKLQNLKTKPELNGQWGVLVEFSQEKKRWSVRVDGMEDMALRAENLQAVSQEEYDAWMAEQANVEASAKYEMEAMLKSRVCGGKTRWTDEDSGKIVRKPGENGNDFDVCMAVEPDPSRASRKVADIIKEKGVCIVEANAPADMIYEAYDEAEKVYNKGQFYPPMQDFGASELEMTIWHQVLFQDESKVYWLGEDQEKKVEALYNLGNNMRGFAEGLKDAVGQKLNITFSNLWDAMLVCYTGDRSYAFHLDNPSMPDEHSLPDNGLRLTLAYFINPHWSPEGDYNGGGLDLFLTPPSGPPESLSKARKANRVRIAPHADTLVVFASQRMAHQVIATKGKEHWYCLWMWCFDEEVMERFPQAVTQHWQKQSGEAPMDTIGEGGVEEDDYNDDVEVIED